MYVPARSLPVPRQQSHMQVTSSLFRSPCISHIIGQHSHVVPRNVLTPSGVARSDHYNFNVLGFRQSIARFATAATVSTSDSGAGSLEQPRKDDVSSNVQEARQWIQKWRSLHQPSKLKLWMMCLKPPMYSVGIVPVLVGACLAYLSSGRFMANTCRELLLGAILVIAWLNLSNDAFDASTGVDDETSKPESIVVLLKGHWQGVLVASLGCLALGLKYLSCQVTLSGSPVPGYLLMAAIACGYVYQGPPFRLSYKGLGEPLCFIAFGPLAVTAFYLCHALQATPGATPHSLLQGNSLLAAASFLVGCTTSIILFCSHFHQIAGDTAAKKFSPLVRLGPKRACQILQVVTVALHIAALVFAYAHPQLERFAPLVLLAAPFAFHMLNFAGENYAVPAKIKPLKILATKWHTTFGIALSLMFFAAGVDLYGAESLA